MSSVTITCPQCGFSRELDRSAIPAGATAVTCSKCRCRFPLGGVPESSAPPAVAPVTAVPITASLPPEPPRTPPDQFVKPPQKPGPQQGLLRFTFTGNARDYFGIWIVNTLLKIVTLGIYSAWAKVRKRRYFYGNTLLDKTPFDYLADPNILFRGWLIAAGFFLLYSAGNKVSPQLSSFLGLLFFLVMPWLIVRSRIFNLRNSDHRNIRFTFNPDYQGAYLVFAGLPLLLPFTLGLIFPYMIYRQKKFFVENSGYGRTRFIFDASAKDFYLLFLKAAAWFSLVIVLLGIAAALFAGAFAELLPLFRNIEDIGRESPARAVVFVVLAGFMALNVLYLYFAIYIQTSLANLTWNATRIKSSRFVSSLKVRDMAWLYLSSAVAIIFSLGLLIPWASIRLARYRMEKLSLNLGDDLEQFLGWGHQPIGPAGEEIGDMFGIDIGL